MNYKIFPPEEILQAELELPLSKSMSARALIINKIGGFDVDIELSNSDDTQALAKGLDITEGTVDIGAAGTAMRFLTAYYAASAGTDIILTGTERMQKRKIGVLVEALRSIGAEIEYLGEEGYPPLHIRGKKLKGGDVEMDPSVSSQYVSALMMIGPMLEEPLTLKFEMEPTSLSYIKMTAAMMAQAGVEPERAFNRIEVPNTPYVAPITTIEKDWSSASYWYAIGALTAGWVTLKNMELESIQGDSVMKTLGERIGVITSESEDVEGALELSASPEQHSRLDLDMSDTPDLVQTLAIAAAALGIPFHFTGIHTLRGKETDRLEALKAEALKLGLIFEVDGNKSISWEGSRVPIPELPRIRTYEDHRMAMAFVPVSVFLPGIIIEDVEVVSKSYPRFWKDLQEAGFILMDPDAKVENSETEE